MNLSKVGIISIPFLLCVSSSVYCKQFCDAFQQNNDSIGLFYHKMLTHYTYYEFAINGLCWRIRISLDKFGPKYGFVDQKTESKDCPFFGDQYYILSNYESKTKKVYSILFTKENWSQIILGQFKTSKDNDSYDFIKLSTLSLIGVPSKPKFVFQNEQDELIFFEQQSDGLLLPNRYSLEIRNSEMVATKKEWKTEYSDLVPFLYEELRLKFDVIGVEPFFSNITDQWGLLVVYRQSSDKKSSIRWCWLTAYGINFDQCEGDSLLLIECIREEPESEESISLWVVLLLLAIAVTVCFV